MSQEYIVSLAIVLVSVLKLFGVEIGNDIVTALLTGVFGLYVAFRRYSKGDITPLGVRKF